jgi:hypothetical protein
MRVRYFCQNCAKELEANQRPCPLCGCNNINVEAVGHVSLGIAAWATSRARKKGKGHGKFKKEVLQGSTPSTNREKFPEGITFQRIIDKEKGEYHHVVIDRKTGEIAHEEHEPLAQHKRGDSHESS